MARPASEYTLFHTRTRIVKPRSRDGFDNPHAIICHVTLLSLRVAAGLGCPATRFARSVLSSSGQAVATTWDPKRYLALSRPSGGPAALGCSFKPPSGFVDETRRVFSRLARVTEKCLDVVAQ